MRLVLQIFFIIESIAVLRAQRYAPGVPPQHYSQDGQPVHQQQYQQQMHHQQQQVPMQHQQQVPVQHQQQVPVQHHQQQHAVPVHQQQHPVPVHQQQHAVPVQQHGHHHAHPQQGQLLNAGNIQLEKDHIQEHMEVPMDTSKMTEQELQFHYFKMHDADNNNKLDGCELIKSLIHWHEQGGKDKTQQGHEEKIFQDEELVALIDPILGMDDSNRDGYIDYAEFIRAQRKATKTN